MNKFLTLGVAALMMAAIPANADDHCTDETADDLGTGLIWVADGGDWIYLESGAEIGLQRGGARATVLDNEAGYEDCDAAKYDILLY